jgi:hypothetical protein
LSTDNSSSVFRDIYFYAQIDLVILEFKISNFSDRLYRVATDKMTDTYINENSGTVYEFRENGTVCSLKHITVTSFSYYFNGYDQFEMSFSEDEV